MHHHRAVLLLVDVHRPARVPARRLARIGVPVDAPPFPHEALHVSCRARAPHREQAASVSGVAMRVRARTLA
jgi:hypothetical protein